MATVTAASDKAESLIYMCLRTVRAFVAQTHSIDNQWDGAGVV